MNIEQVINEYYGTQLWQSVSSLVNSWAAINITIATISLILFVACIIGIVRSVNNASDESAVIFALSLVFLVISAFGFSISSGKIYMQTIGKDIIVAEKIIDILEEGNCNK